MSKSATQPKLKRVHYFQHVEFKGLGSIEPLLAAHNCKLDSTRWFAGEQAPASDSYDLLIVMGGPMGIFDYELYPWLKAEKLALKAAIEAGVERLKEVHKNQDLEDTTSLTGDSEIVPRLIDEFPYHPKFQ